MSTSARISLPLAILINVNIMLGSGIFINTVQLAKRAGLASALGYLMVGLLMLPLVLCIAKLINWFPDGGFYEYARAGLGEFAGFFSAWCYFISKLASATVMIHISMMLLQSLFSWIACVPILALDLGILLLFIYFNLQNIRTSSIIQIVFMTLKLIPILFVLIVGAWAFVGVTYPQQVVYWNGLWSAFPIVMYALLGFEAACSISNKIVDPERNGPRAVVLSFLFVASILTLFQAMIVWWIGESIITFADFRLALPAFINRLLVLPAYYASVLVAVLHAAIAASALGGSYGILFSNNWNLFYLGRAKLLPGSKYFTRLNASGMATLCVLAEGLICCFYLMLLHGFGAEVVYLQQLGALGSTTAYGLSAFSYGYFVFNKIKPGSIAIALLSLFACFLLASLAVYNLWIYGMSSLILFIVLLAIGMSSYVVKKNILH